MRTHNIFHAVLSRQTLPVTASSTHAGHLVEWCPAAPQAYIIHLCSPHVFFMVSMQIEAMMGSEFPEDCWLVASSKAPWDSGGFFLLAYKN